MFLVKSNDHPDCQNFFLIPHVGVWVFELSNIVLLGRRRHWKNIKKAQRYPLCKLTSYGMSCRQTWRECWPVKIGLDKNYMHCIYFSKRCETYRDKNIWQIHAKSRTTRRQMHPTIHDSLVPVGRKKGARAVVFWGKGKQKTWKATATARRSKLHAWKKSKISGLLKLIGWKAIGYPQRFSKDFSRRSMLLLVKQVTNL